MSRSRCRVLAAAALTAALIAGCGTPASDSAPPSEAAAPAARGVPTGGREPVAGEPGGREPGAREPGAAPARSGLAHGFDVGEIKPARAYLDEPRFAAADLERGELLSLACQACHTLRRGQRHNVGPNLYGVFGRRAASAPDFAYSDALEGTGLVWTPKALEAWLAAPAEFVIGNNMVFAGYASDTDRRDLIAFLLRVTSPEATPEASVE